VYSYGVMAWETFAQKHPFADQRDINSLRKFVVTEKHRPNLTEDIKEGGDAVKAFLKKCWDDDPNQRYSFEQLDCPHENNKEPWSSILATAVADDSKTTRDYWQKLTESSKNGQVKWNLFVSEFTLFFHNNNINNKNPEHFALKLILNVNDDPKDKEGSVDQSIVAYEAWSMVVDWFGPFERTAGAKLTKLYELLLQPWFHGPMSVDDANIKLCMHPAGTFLVRFSSQKSLFTISWVGRDKNKILTVQHYRFEEKNSETIVTRVIDFLKQSDISASFKGKKPTPCPDRPVKYEEFVAQYGPKDKKSVFSF